MEQDNSISKMLAVILVFLIFLLFVLIFIYIVVKIKNNSRKKAEKITSSGEAESNETKFGSYNKHSIFEFMEFENIQDNMIIQNNGRKYLAIVECQGVNYDLMSRVEKNAVEEGFQQFLNTLRHPIQIYIQTRTINLESSLQTYKTRVKAIEDKYNKMNREYARMRESMAYSEEQLSKYNFELVKNRNLLEYGKDIINNTERMSLNQNVLTKRYFVIIPFYPEEVDKYDKEELKSMAFSELYTKAQSVLATLSACSITGKMLNSRELVELLYVAYNREESDTYGIDKAIQADYDSLYSTAPDVYEQRIKILDDEIKRQGIELANRKIEKAKSVAQQKAEEKEDDMSELIRRMAEIVLQDNRKYVDKEIIDEAERSLKEDDDFEEGGEA